MAAKKKTKKAPAPQSDETKEKENKEEEKSEVVSRKKVIYAEIDDEVTVIFDRISKVPLKQIYIVVPQRAILFQSVVNLKILKRKAEDDGKKIYLITNDSNGVYLAQKSVIEVFSKANSDGFPGSAAFAEGDEKMKITPLKATINSVEDSAPTRLKEKKLSISQILSKNKSGKNSGLDVTKIKNEPEKKKKTKSPRLVMVTPNRHALIGLIVGSLLILLVIVYIALPGATVYLTPAASVLEKSVNITLADYQKNQAALETSQGHMIASYPISHTVRHELTHYATGKKFSARGANATGRITIINTSDTAWPLVAQTRFQTNEGIVFRITDSVTVPAATVDGPGTLEAFVTADVKDAYGAIVGERGNIEPSRLFLPGLREDSRSKIYAENKEAMTGGVTDFVTYVSAEDIEAARQRIRDELLKVATEELRAQVVEKGDLIGNTEAFTLLEGDGSIKTGEVRVFEPAVVDGQEIGEFVIAGEVDVSGVYYDHDGMLEILKSELTLKKSPQKELLRVNEESTSYRIFDWDEAGGKIKLTANIKGIEQYSIDADKESGARLLQKIRDHIAGKEIEDAKTYIQNLQEVNKVEIESWPAWSPTVPGLPENIDFEIRPAVEI